VNLANFYLSATEKEMLFEAGKRAAERVVNLWLQERGPEDRRRSATARSEG
jgi:hypothetical protein